MNTKHEKEKEAIKTFFINYTPMHYNYTTNIL